MQIVTYFSDYIFFAFIFIQLQGVYFLCSETNSAIFKTLMRLETEDNVLNLFKKLQEEVKVHQNIHVLTIRQFFNNNCAYFVSEHHEAGFPCQPLPRKMASVGAFESCLFKVEFL